MSIDFKRNRAQCAYEEILGIDKSQLKDKKELFSTHSLSEKEANVIREALKKDAVDYFYNAAISFLEGIDAAYKYRFSWATVKLYYSVFYSIRATMACRNIAILTNQHTFRLNAKKQEKPFGSSNSKYKSTHKGTINHYIDCFEGTDYLLTNKIDDKNVYYWLEEVREIVNYREVCFTDPNALSFWDVFKEAIDYNRIDELISKLQVMDDYTFCFQEEYAIVAIPIKRMQATILDLIEADLMDKIAIERKTYIKEILKSEKSISVFNDFLK